jgi:hypothetical protein
VDAMDLEFELGDAHYSQGNASSLTESTSNSGGLDDEFSVTESQSQDNFSHTSGDC